MAVDPYWSLHSHSRYSATDGMPQVKDMVGLAAKLGYPALGLTDHGNLSGTVQLYKECRKKGIEPLPGMELYMTGDRSEGVRAHQHLTVAAYSEVGYRNLVTLNNLAVRNFWFKPRLDFADLADLAEAGHTQGLVVATGCYFGVVQQSLINHGPEAAKQIIKALASWFPEAYVELHNHGVSHGSYTDEDMVWELVALAEECGLPYIIASDAHYLVPEEQPAHEAMKELVSWSEDPSESAFPGGPYCLLDNEMLAGKFEPDILANSNAYLAELAGKSKVWIPELEEFRMKVPDVTKTGDADKELEDLVWAAAWAMWPEGMGKVETLRLESELDVIRRSGFAGYILLVAFICSYMRDEGIWFHARGSASGAMILWLLKVTQQPPLYWSLRMDRFMSADRTRPPDVDLDVEDQRRDEVVVKLQEQFSVRQVGSHMQLGLTEQLDPNGESMGKGSLLIKYFTVIGKTKGKSESNPKTWNEVPHDDQQLLIDLADRKLISGPGTHAAGYIVAPDEAAVAELPLTRMGDAKKPRYVTAYGKKDVEALGFCKIDLLGLKTKTAVRIACEAIVTRNNLDISPVEFYEAIPNDDKKTLARIGRGDTEGMFQLEGYTMMRGCRDMKPKKTSDIVAAQAIYRPAILKAKLDKLYLARRTGKQPVPEVHPDIMLVTKDTYGIALYQEQIIELCRVIGMGPDELTDTLDAVKASNAATEEALVFLNEIKARVGELATARGWNERDVAWLVDGLAGYAEYSFNKAHSVSYGLEAYRSGYLAEHHPLEFWVGVLTAYANSKKEVGYVRAARRFGVRVLPAHVNTSGASYTIHNDAIRKGLLSIHGVGVKGAAELARHAPYSSLTDLGQRVTAKQVSGAKGLALKKPPMECGGMVAALYEYDALTGLEV